LRSAIDGTDLPGTQPASIRSAIPPSHDIVKAAVGNQDSGAEIMRIVLDRTQVIITEAAVAAIFRLFSGSPNDGSGDEMSLLT